LYRLICTFVLFCSAFALGCSAQAPSGSQLSPELKHKIEVQIRNRFAGRIPPTVKFDFSERQPSKDFGGWDSATVYLVMSNGQRHEIPLLLSRDNKEIVHVERVSLESTIKIDTTGRPVRGNPNAKVKVISFDDFQCPYCAKSHAALFPTLLNEYGDRVAFIYKDFPLEEIHPWAVRAAVNANCLAAQSGDAYWQYADYIHENQKTIIKDNKDQRRPEAEQVAQIDNAARQTAAKASLDSNLLNACMQKRDETAVRSSMKEGNDLGIDGTPYLFVNGERVGANYDVNELRRIIDRALVAAGEKPGNNTASSAPTPSATVNK
jgi:protein-disulfide isomerase